MENKSLRQAGAEVARQRLENRALRILAQHAGRSKSIGMGELFEAVYQEPWNNRINDTRALRQLITDLRKEGLPICSDGTGYWLASAGSEVDDYCARLRQSALKRLALEARVRRTSLAAIVGQMQLNLGACSSGSASPGQAPDRSLSTFLTQI